MLYQLHRPFQAYPIYFDMPDHSPVLADLPDWFGSSWQIAPPSLRPGANPLLIVDPSWDYPLDKILNFAYNNNSCKDGFFAFHGGAVTKGEDAYLFLASTTTGKTTLIAYLTQMGYSFLNDDCFYLDMDTMEVYPFCAPIHLREGGFQYLQSVLPEPLTKYQYMAARSAPRYVYFPENRTKQLTKPRGIFFLNRTEDPTVTDSCQPMSSFHALSQLMISSLIPYQVNKTYLEFFRRLVPLCYQLTYHNASYVASILPEVCHD